MGNIMTGTFKGRCRRGVARGLRLAFLACVCLNVFFLPDVDASVGNDHIRNAIEGSVFIFDASTAPCTVYDLPLPPRSALRALGSGFVIRAEPEEAATGPKDGSHPINYLITCEHVIAGRDAVILRVNRSDKAEFACFPVSLIREGKNRNVFVGSRREADLAAIKMPLLPNTRSVAFDPALVANEDLMKKENIVEGTEVFTVGYLLGYSGKERNFPVVKFGKIAMLSNELWYRGDTSRNLYEEAYLIDLQSEFGLSGAPVMLQSPTLRMGNDGQFTYHSARPYIVGIVKGGLRSLVGGSQGITAIEPAHHLKELLREIQDSLSPHNPPD